MEKQEEWQVTGAALKLMSMVFDLQTEHMCLQTKNEFSMDFKEPRTAPSQQPQSHTPSAASLPCPSASIASPPAALAPLPDADVPAPTAVAVAAVAAAPAAPSTSIASCRP